MKTKAPDTKLSPVTPGEILKEEFMVPLGLTNYRVAKDIGISPTAVGQIVAGTRSLTPDTALRLGTYFGMTAQFWMNAQSQYDLRRLARDAASRPQIERCAALAA